MSFFNTILKKKDEMKNNNFSFNQNSSKDKINTSSSKNPFSDFFNRSKNTSLGSRGRKNDFEPEQYNFQLRSQDDWTAPEYCAFGRVTGNKNVFDDLNNSTDTRGTKYWNAYRGGRSVLPDGCKEFFKNNFGYEGPFDQQFCDDFNSIYGNDVSFSKTLGVSTPTKKSSVQEWAGWYVTQIQDNLIENKELDRQYADYRKSLNDYYDQYLQVNGRAPTYEEFEAVADSSKYSKLKNIDDSLQYATKLQILPSGTYYSPDILPGLYQAKQNGEDINADRDYFDDAVKYYMNPVQKTQSIQKYTWSNSNLSETSEEDRDKYLKQLYANGEYEEADAFQYAWWAAQPHADGVVATPSALDSNYGYRHTEEWFNKVDKAIGDEYKARLDVNGEFIGKHGDKASYMDNICWEYHQAQKNREKTLAVEQQYGDFISAIPSIFNATVQSGGNYEDFSRHVDEELEEYLKENPELKTLLDDGYDVQKYCRDPHISSESINVMKRYAWNGRQLSTDIDYAAIADQDMAYAAPYAHYEPDEMPLLYEEDQKKNGMQRMLDRDNAESSVTEAVASLAESGAVISKGSIPVVNNTFQRMFDFGDAAIGLLGKVWMDVFGDKHSEKLGVDFTPSEAAAADPVLAQIGVQDMPETLTANDVLQMTSAKAMSRAFDDDICIADGIINYALPGSENLHQTLMGRTSEALSKKFNALTYRNVYNDRIEAGVSKGTAADIALFAATDLNYAIELIGNRYQGNDKLNDATHRLLNDIAQEDGSIDSYDMFMAIGSDVYGALQDDGPKADAIMGNLYSALLLGSSDAATPGFRAETNQIVHDITTGAITPEDIIMAMDPESYAAKAPTARDIVTGDNRSVNGSIALSNGKEINTEQYNDIIQGELSQVRTPTDIDNLSEEAKAIINYDGVVDTAKKMYGDNPAAEKMMVMDAVEFAEANTSETDNYWHTNPVLHGTTDFIGAIDAIGNGKNERDIHTTLIGNGIKQPVSFFNDPYGWAKEKFQGWRNKDRTNITAYASAFLSTVDPEFFEMDDTSMTIGLFRANGKFFSKEEVDYALNAYDSGIVSYDDLKKLVDERIENSDSRIVNALNDPEAVEKSYAALDEGMEKARERASVVNNIPEWAKPELFDPNMYSSDPDMASDENPLKKPDYYYDYTDQELSVMEETLEMFKSLGTNGVVMSGMDAESMKIYFGIDLEGTRFENAPDILNAISPEWSVPYYSNPGYTYGMVQAVGGGFGNIGSVLEIPALANKFFHELGYAMAGEEWNPETAPDPLGLNRSYLEYKKIKEQKNQEKTNVATKEQAFVETAVGEVVRNLLTSGIGTALGNAYAVKEAARLTGLNHTLSSITGLQDILKAPTKMLSRSVFASSAVLNSYEREREAGNDVLTSAIKGSISGAIELVTEDMAFEKLYSKPFGSMAFSRHATNAAGSLGAYGIKFINRTGINVATEISEEEASEFLGRCVEAFDLKHKGENLENAFNKAFENYGEAALETAKQTAFTTLIFGCMDLGGATYDLIHDRMSSGTQVNTERLMECIESDLHAYADRNTEDNQDTEQMPEYVEQQTEESKKTAQQTEQDEEEDEISDIFREYILNNGATNADQDIETQVEKNTDNTALSAEETEENTKTQEATEEEAASTEQEETDNNKKAETSETASRLEKAIRQAIESRRDTLRTEAMINAQESLSEPATPVDTASNENTQAIDSAAQEVAAQLPESAQRVRDYINHSEQATNNAIIEKGTDIASEKAVMEDEGLRNRQENIQNILSKANESNDKIAQMQEQATIISNQAYQIYNAAVSSGVELNSAPVINASFQNREKLNSVNGDISIEQSKLEELMKQAQIAQEQLEAEKQRIAEEAKKQAAEELRREIEKAEKEKQEKAIADTKAELFEKGGADALYNDMRKGAEREMNAQTARQNSMDIHSYATDAEEKSNEIQTRSEQDLATYEYEQQLPYTRGTSATETFTDPSRYSRKSNTTETRSDAWKDDSKHRQDQMNDDIEYEQRDRMRNAFDTWRETNAPQEYVPITRDKYEKIRQAISRDTSIDPLNNRFIKTSDKPGESAPVYSQRSFKEGWIEKNVRTVTRENRGYSKFDGEKVTSDYINEDGTITGLTERIISAVDPEFTERIGLLKTNTSNGGTDTALEYVTENNRYIILGANDQDRETFDETEADRDEELYNMLTKEKGLQYRSAEVDQAKKRYDGYLNRIARLKKEIEQYAAASRNPENDTTDASLKWSKANKELTQAENGLKFAKEELEKKQKQYDWESEYVKWYKTNRTTDNKRQKTYYIIDKFGVEDIDQEAITRQAILQARNKTIADLPEEIRDRAKEEFKGYGPDYEKRAILNYFIPIEYDRILRETYKDCIQIISGDQEIPFTEGETISADEELKDFVRRNGGYSMEGFGGEGFTKFKTPSFWFKHEGYFATEEAILKYLPEEEHKGLVLTPNKDDNGNPIMTDFNTTNAQYNANIRASIRRYASENGLTQDETRMLEDEFTVRMNEGKTIGKNTIISHDDEHFIGVPTKSLNDPSKNKYIRGEDGSIDIGLAKKYLRRKLREMVNIDEEQMLDAPGTKRKLDTRKNSIQVDFIDDTGRMRNGIKIGEFYSWWNGGSKFFPTFDELMERSDKITCNFPVINGRNNQDSFVNFVLKPNNEANANIARELESVDIDDVEGELTWRRGHSELEQDVKRAEEWIEMIPANSDVAVKASLALTHAQFNLTKNELFDALEKAKTCSPDKLDYMQNEVARLYLKFNEIQSTLRRQEESNANQQNRSGTGGPANLTYLRLGEARNEFDKLAKKPASAARDQRMEELHEQIMQLEQEHENEKEPVREFNEREDQREKRNTKREEVESAFGRTMPSAEQRYKKAKERYDELTNPKNPYFGDESFDHERTVLSIVIPALEQLAEEDKTEAANNPVQKAPKPDRIGRKVAESIMNQKEATATKPKQNTPKTKPILLTKNGEQAKATVTTVQKIKPEQYDNVYAIVRSMRRPKKGVTQLQALSPSMSLLRDYNRWKNNGEWNREKFEQEYLPRFIEEMKQPEARKALNKLYKELKDGKNIALTCFCGDESLCHRSIIAGILQGLGVDIATEGGADYSRYYEMYFGKQEEAEETSDTGTEEETVETPETEITEDTGIEDTEKASLPTNNAADFEESGDQQVNLTNAEKLIVLRHLANNGADISDLITKATEQYHEEIMSGMNSNERIDYLTNLAKQQQTNDSSMFIDPNTNYESMLGKEIEEQLEKSRSKDGKRLRYIAKKAGNYKNLGKAKSVMAELENLERAGFDVADAKARMQENIDRLSTPFEERKEAILEKEPDEARKDGLQMLADDTPSKALDSATGEADEVLAPLREITDDIYREAQNNPVTPTPVNSEETRDQTEEAPEEPIATPLPEAEPTDGSAPGSLDEISDAIIDDMSIPAKPAEIKTGFEPIINGISESNATYSSEEDVQKLESEVANLGARISDLNDSINETIQSLRVNKKQFGEIGKQIATYETMPGHLFTDEDRDTFEHLKELHEMLNIEIARQEYEKDQMINERNKAREERRYLGSALTANIIKYRIAHDQIAFVPEDIIGDNSRQQFMDNRQKSKNMASTVMKRLENATPYANKTEFTREEINKAIAGDSESSEESVIDEFDLKFNRDIANGVGKILKEQKQDAILLKLGKASIDLKTGVIDEEEYKTLRKTAKEDIIALTPETGMTTEDFRIRDRVRDAAENAIQDWEMLVMAHMAARAGDLDSVRTLYDIQLQTINDNIERANEIVNTYYKTSSEGIMSELNENNGGHFSIPMMRLMAGIVLNGNDTVRNKNFHPIALTFEAMPQIADRYLGKYSGLFNSIYTAPVMEANGKIAREVEALREGLKKVHLDTAEQRRILSNILDNNMSDEDIRSSYGDIADKLIAAKNFHQHHYEALLDRYNVVAKRNGLPLMLKRNNYFPHIRKETNSLLHALGLNSEMEELPVGVLGNTSDTTPATQFNPHMLERTGEGLEYMEDDAEFVFLRYTDYILRNIHQTDNIIRLNDLITTLGRDRAKEKGNKPGYLDYSDTMTLKKGNMATFVKALEYYRDMLANKKVGKLDRAIEETFMRKSLSVLRAANKLQGVAKVGGNLNPNVANFIPVYTVIFMNPISGIKAIYGTAANAILKQTGHTTDGIAERSNFLASRNSNHHDVKTTYDKIARALFIPMEITDSISSEIVYRTCYDMSLKKFNGDKTKAIRNADRLCLNIMSDKSTGMKGKAYASTIGSTVLQFTQEGINNLRFLREDLFAYMGAKNGGASAIAGVAKAITALLAMMAGGAYGMNKLTGRNTAPDVIGAIQKAINGKEEDDSVFDIASDALTNVIDALNPIENISDGNLLEAPVPRGVIDILDAMKSAIVSGADMAIDAILEGNKEEDDWSWVEKLAKAVFGWMPGSTMANRVIETATAANRGYAAKNGKMAFPFDATAGNIFKGIAFGINSVDQAQEYVNSGYRRMSDKRIEGATFYKNYYKDITWAEAIDMYDANERSKTLNNEGEKQTRRGQNNKETLDMAMEEREKAQIPYDTIDTSSSSLTNNQKKTLEKGYALWVETGKATYPKRTIRVYEDEELGKYIQDGGKDYPITDDELKEIDNYIIQETIYNIERHPDDADAIEKAVKDANTEARKRFCGR